MIKTDNDIRHALAHIEIGEAAVKATTGQQRFSPNTLSQFFRTLRESHREALVNYSTKFTNVIGLQEHDELHHYGMFGQFAGRIAVRESGLATIERELHSLSPPELQTALRGSLTQAANILKNG